MEAKTVVELRRIARQNNVARTSCLRKAALVTALLEVVPPIALEVAAPQAGVDPFDGAILGRVDAMHMFKRYASLGNVNATWACHGELDAYTEIERAEFSTNSWKTGIDHVIEKQIFADCLEDARIKLFDVRNTRAQSRAVASIAGLLRDIVNMGDINLNVTCAKINLFKSKVVINLLHPSRAQPLLSTFDDAFDDGNDRFPSCSAVPLMGSPIVRHYIYNEGREKSDVCSEILAKMKETMTASYRSLDAACTVGSAFLPRETQASWTKQEKDLLARTLDNVQVYLNAWDIEV